MLFRSVAIRGPGDRVIGAEAITLQEISCFMNLYWWFNFDFWIARTSLLANQRRSGGLTRGFVFPSSSAATEQQRGNLYGGADVSWRGTYLQADRKRVCRSNQVHSIDSSDCVRIWHLQDRPPWATGEAPRPSKKGVQRNGGQASRHN